MPLHHRPDAVLKGVVDRGNLTSLSSITRVDIVCEMAQLNSVNAWTPAAFDACTTISITHNGPSPKLLAFASLTPGNSCRVPAETPRPMR